ncbi:hypothetical protein TNCV_204481 [Trichonephila clavipes]|nr:hypothetical protein TNCV_204481 [Trichonephila clavipes]
MSRYALCKMIQKFETTGYFDILPGRERKHILSSGVQNVTTAVIEASNLSPDDSDTTFMQDDAPPYIDRSVKSFL